MTECKHENAKPLERLDPNADGVKWLATTFRGCLECGEVLDSSETAE